MGMITPTPGTVEQPQQTSPITDGLRSLGKDDFLHLLIAKLQNQDPLDPMEDEDFVAQLAQFSSLEQMANIADGIAESNQWDYLQMQSINNVMAAGLIGKEVTASYSAVYFDGQTSPKISFSTDVYADQIDIVIRDNAGAVVATLTERQVEAGTHRYEWDGRDDTGNQVDAGHYQVEAIATDAEGNTFKPPLSLVGIVEAVTYRDGSAYFRVDGVEVPFGDVAAIGAGGASDDDD